MECLSFGGTLQPYFKDNYSCLLACILLGCWLFISTYKADIDTLFCMIIFDIP